MVVDWALVESAEYEELYAIEQDVRSIGPAPYYASEVVAKEPKEIPLEDADALWYYNDQRGRKNTTIQRYKVGEVVTLDGEAGHGRRRQSDLAQLVDGLVGGRDGHDLPARGT